MSAAGLLGPNLVTLAIAGVGEQVSGSGHYQLASAQVPSVHLISCPSPTKSQAVPYGPSRAIPCLTRRTKEMKSCSKWIPLWSEYCTYTKKILILS